jgi:hypothetical protein
LPQHFKQFHKAETRGNYIDCSTNIACPAWVARQEAQLIWNDTAIKPDIFLSIGTGRNVLESTQQKGPRVSQLVSSTSDSIDTISTEPPKSLPLRPIISKTGLRKVASGIDPEQTWDKFISSSYTPNSPRPIDDSYQYIRVNPKLNMDTPNLDNVKQLEGFEREAEEVVSQDIVRIKEIAHRLVSSSFFFEKSSNTARQVADGYKYSGRFFQSM